MKHPFFAIAVLFAAATAIGCDAGQTLNNPVAPGAAAAPGGNGQKAQGDLAVTTVVYDLDSNGVATDTYSDGLGSYTDGVAGVRSVLAKSAYNNLTYGDWQFETMDSPSRGVGHRFDAEDAVQPGDPFFIMPAAPPYWGAQVLKTKLQMMCTVLGKSMLTMTAGSSMTCGMLNKFVSGGLEYGLQTSPAFTGFAETTDVQVTCSAADAGGCRDWSIEPIGLDRALGRLTRALSPKRPDPKTHIGNLYERFRFHITRP